jgi:arylsulfatase A-like enzyme
MRFDQSFVVNSLCSPARACILTGQYSGTTCIISNDQPFPSNVATFVTRLHDAGYRTAICGKWHFGQQRDRPGFDFAASFIGQGKYFDCPILLNGQTTSTTGWIDDVSTDYAINFLRKQPKEEPFLLYVAFKSPHQPRGDDNLPEWARELYQGKESLPVPNLGARASYKSAAQPSNRDNDRRVKQQDDDRNYMRHVTALDRCVGRLFDALVQTGQSDRTIVIVTSDNGYYLGEHDLSDKRSAYEESIRVPLLIRLPGDDAPRGKVNRDNMVLNIDYCPTILDFAEAKSLPNTDGCSLRRLLNGESPANWREAFRYEYFKEVAYSEPEVQAVRTATHKLILYPGHEDWTEAFDLTVDPYETKNLSDDRELVEELRAIQARETGPSKPGSRHVLLWTNGGVLALLLLFAGVQRVHHRTRSAHITI